MMEVTLYGGASGKQKAATPDNQDAAKNSILHHTGLYGLERVF